MATLGPFEMISVVECEAGGRVGTCTVTVTAPGDSGTGMSRCGGGCFLPSTGSTRFTRTLSFVDSSLPVEDRGWAFLTGDADIQLTGRTSSATITVHINYACLGYIYARTGASESYYDAACTGGRYLCASVEYWSGGNTLKVHSNTEGSGFTNGETCDWVEL